MKALFADSLNPGVRRREVLGWAMYDFATSGCTTVVITAVFAAYFVGGVPGGVGWDHGLVAFEVARQGRGCGCSFVSLGLGGTHGGRAALLNSPPGHPRPGGTGHGGPTGAIVALGRFAAEFSTQSPPAGPARFAG